jgi:hypothetical protein
MMKQLTFLELARKILSEEKRPLSVEEIWEVAQSKGYDKLVETTGNTPPASIGSRLYIDIRDRKDSPFIKVGLRPRRFYLRSLVTDGDGISLLEKETVKSPPPKKFSYLEKDLHPLLAYFAHFYLKAYTKTIHHPKSEKKEFGEWTHPDMVGCYFPIDDWKPEVFEFSSMVGSVAIKLFSFEIKRELSFSNLRESFFQTVSNSSWANEAYLAASKVSKDEDFLSELRRLSTSFGVGVISLNVNDPDSSGILFPAKDREYLDWDMMNKLTTMNSDFREFLNRIRKDITSKEIRKEFYDPVLAKEALVASLHK